MMIFQSDVDIEKSEETLIPKVEEIHKNLKINFVRSYYMQYYMTKII